MGIIYEKGDRIACITLNRPERRNALDPETLIALEEACQDFNADPESWVLIVTGAGDKAFCSGADLETLIPAMTSGAMKMELSAKRFFSDIYKPIIAAINGYCLAGGTEMIQGTDIRVAAEHATFGLAEPRWGLAPIGGSHVRLPRQIPWCRAMEILLIGDRMSAQEALQVGLINRVVPLEQLMPTARAIAERICENGPLAVQTIKEIAVRAVSMPMEQGFVLETLMGQRVFASEDAREGPRAFLEKRKPVFKGQ
ncbi:MAG: enoyl-CoA hydratase-related protein [Chloroflexota bacterium]|nr:enoyl-CoA hydratase-related protein [Chloroflexota bacterium]